MIFRILVLITSLLLTAMLPRPAAAESDSRFFGTYCGSHSETVRVTVRFLGIPIRRPTFTLEFSVTAQVDHETTPRRHGLIHGSGEAVLENENVPGWVRGLLPAEAREFIQPGSRLPVVFSGAVERRGVAGGSGSMPGWGSVRATGRLSSDGNALAVAAAGSVITVHKDRCGNAAPSVRIVSPAADRFSWGEHIEFRGAASDPEDTGFPGERLVWESDRDGELGTGLEARVPSTRVGFLSTGRHRIRFIATDSGGRFAVAEKIVDVEDNTPRAWIDSPDAGDPHYAGLPITFRGRATDRETGQLSGGSMTWSVDGTDIGSGELLSRTLTEGSHDVTLRATDGSSTGTAGVTITVSPVPPGGADPSITIVSPENHIAVSDLGDDCHVLAANVFDLEDDPSDLTVVWEDQAAGEAGWRSLGTGQRIEQCAFPAGAHDTVRFIRATVTDSSGNTADDRIRIVVIPGGLI